MIAIRTVAILIFMVLSHNLTSQHLIKGSVYDLVSGTPIIRAVVSYTDTIKNKLLAFAWTDDLGVFEMNVEDIHAGHLTAAALGYTLEFTQQNISGDYEILMISTEESINEVIETIEIKAKKEYFGRRVVARYEAGIYKDSLNDRLEDLISNIPGITLDRSDGSFSYYNQPITDVLLDGDNLMSGNYAPLTQNVSQDVANSIEVILGYTENIVLDAMNSQQAYALNIQVDSSYANRLSGTLKIGVNDEVDFVSDTDLLGLSGKNKFFLIADLQKGFTGFASRAIHQSEYRGRDLLLVNPSVFVPSKLTPFGRVSHKVYNPNFGVLNISEVNKVSVNGLSKLNNNHRFQYNISATKHANFFNQSTYIRSLDRRLPDYKQESIGALNTDIHSGTVDYNGILGKRLQLSAYLDLHNMQAKDSLEGLINNTNFERPLKSELPMIKHGYQLAARIGENQGIIVSTKFTSTHLDTDLDYILDDTLQYPLSIIGETISTVRAQYLHTSKLKQNEYNFNYALKLSSRIIVKALALYKDMDLNNETELLAPDSYFSVSNLNARTFEKGLHFAYVNKDWNIHMGVSNAHISSELNDNKKNIWLYNGILQKKWSLYDFRLSASRTTSLINMSTISSIPYVRDEINFSVKNFDNIAFSVQNSETISLIRRFPKTKQELSFRMEYSHNTLPFIQNYNPDQDRILNFIQNDPSSRNQLYSELSFESYWPKLRHLTRLIIKQNNLNLQDKQNNLYRNISVNESGLVVEIKSFFSSRLNYAFDMSVSKVNSSVSASKDKSGFSTYTFLGALNYKINNKVKVKSMIDMNNNNGSNLAFVNMDIGLSRMLKNVDFNFQVYNMFNTSQGGRRGFNSGYRVVTNQMIQSRLITILLTFTL